MAKSSKTFKSSKSRKASENIKLLKILYDDPIIIPHTPEHSEENPLPAENNHWAALIIIGGTIAALLCLWFLAPDWIKAIGDQLVQWLLPR